MTLNASSRTSQNAPFRPAIPGFRVLDSWASGSLAASVFSRGDGEAIWQHDHHRLVVPLTGRAERNVAIRIESGPARQFQWNDSRPR
jgi:hypothetical protein